MAQKSITKKQRKTIRDSLMATGNSPRAAERLLKDSGTPFGYGTVQQMASEMLDSDTTAAIAAKDATIRALRTTNKRLVEQVGNWDEIGRRFTDAAQSLPVPKVLSMKGIRVKREYEMVALFSDSHCNEHWNGEITDGMTEYGFDLFCSMLWYYGQEIIRIAEMMRPVMGMKRLHVDILGDIYHGTLREDDTATNQFGTVTGISSTAYVIFQWLLALVEHFEAVIVECVPGNHARLDSPKQSKRYVEENHDTLVYVIIKQCVAAAGLQDRIRINIPRSRLHTLTRLGHRVTIGHGDIVKGGAGLAGVPVHGLSRENLNQYKKMAFPNLKGERHKPASLIEFGHWHQSFFLFDRVILNGSMRPACPWSFDNLGAMNELHQTIYFTCREHTYSNISRLNLAHGAKTKHGFVYDQNMWVG